MRWVSVIVMLAWMMQAPLADIAYGEPAAVSTDEMHFTY